MSTTDGVIIMGGWRHPTDSRKNVYRYLRPSRHEGGWVWIDDRTKAKVFTDRRKADEVAQQVRGFVARAS